MPRDADPPASGAFGAIRGVFADASVRRILLIFGVSFTVPSLLNHRKILKTGLLFMPY
jgi:hypothetical protein